MNSAPGITPTNSSQKSYVALEALGPVVIRTLGGAKGSVEEGGEKKEANGSEAMSRADSSVGCWPDVDAEEGSAVRIDGSNSRVLSNVRGTFSARRFYPTDISMLSSALHGADLLRNRITSFNLGLRKSLLKLLLVFCPFIPCCNVLSFYFILDCRRLEPCRHCKKMEN
jgi:hypothetical protein